MSVPPGANYDHSIRVCILLAKSMDPGTYEQALAGTVPRPEYLVLREALDADLYDFDDVRSSSSRFVRVARRLGPRFGLAALGFSLRKRYDHFYCTGEDIALPFGMMMTAALDFGRITAVVHNIGTSKRRTLIRLIPSRVWRYVVCICDAQQRVLLDTCRLPAELVQRMPYWIDTRFYDPSLVVGDHDEFDVLACGRETRDYETLSRAASGSDLTFHVIASGWHPGVGFGVMDTARAARNLEVEGSALSYVDLRQRYASARVVAVPLEQVEYAAGVTSITEAMSMAKPIVASSSTGIVDYVDGSKVGALTPVRDADALRSALERIAADPEHAAAVGRRNRIEAEEQFAVERHAERLARMYGMDLRSGPLQQAR